MSFILHMTERSAWEEAEQAGVYTAVSLTTEGFIHCSTPDQLLGVAHNLYHGRENLVLLLIDPDRVAPEIIYEDCYETGQKFPHIYGPLSTTAVVRVLPFPCQPDGTFTLPTELSESS